MKEKFVLLLVLLLGISMVACSNGNSQNDSQPPSKPIVENGTSNTLATGKNAPGNTGASALVVYYSYSGNTKRVAERLAAILGADTYEIRTVNAYPNDNHQTALVSQEERRTGNLPKIVDDLPDISAYNTIYIGGPIWNAYMATPLERYFELTDFTGKKIAPFWTSQSSGGSGYVKDFEDRAKNLNKISEGLGISYSEDKSDAEIDKLLHDWLTKIGG